MPIRIEFDGKQAGRRWREKMQKRGTDVAATSVAAAQLAAADIERQGRANIRQAGKFGRRWTEGFTAVVSRGGANVLITVQQAVTYWRVFQYGATIRGKPMLWIPLSFAKDAIGVMARNFKGGLFRVDRKSGAAPLLLSRSDGQPKYFGKESVRIPKKFRLKEISAEVSRKFPDYYQRALRARRR